MNAGVRSPAGRAPDVLPGVGDVKEISASERTVHWFHALGSTPRSNGAIARIGEHAVSEREFEQRVIAWRAALSQVPNNAIALYDSDGVNFAAALVAAWYTNKTVYLPGDVQPDTCRLLVAQNIALVGAAEAFPANCEVVVCGERSADVAIFEPLEADLVQVVIFTSGSTGAPQAIPKQLSQLLAEVETLEELFGASLGDSEILATVSHQHIYGLLFKILWPLVTGRTFVSVSVTYPEQLIELLAARRTAVVSGPAHLKRLPATLNWASVRNHVSLVFSSGGPLPASAAASVEELLSQAPVEVYGSSETGGIAWRQRTNNQETPWTPLPRVTVAARDGQLVVRSPHLPNDEWFTVADGVTFDSNNNFTLLGRTDRLAKVEGKRVSLAGMETALLESGLVAEARVVQLPAARDELGAAVIPNNAGWEVLQSGGTRELRRRLDSVLVDIVERIALPRKWRWLDQLPVNASGKIVQADIVDLFAAASSNVPVKRVLDSSAAHATIELYVSPQLACFDGHFKQLPVLAGVVQTDWAIMFGKVQFGINTSFDRMEAVKFQRVYQPGAPLMMHLQWDAERRLLAFRFESGSSVHSSGRIFFAS